jgi:hypothetical protein
VMVVVAVTEEETVEVEMVVEAAVVAEESRRGLAGCAAALIEMSIRVVGLFFVCIFIGSVVYSVDSVDIHFYHIHLLVVLRWSMSR